MKSWMEKEWTINFFKKILESMVREKKETRYRILDLNYVRYLQYYKEKKFLFWNLSYWEYIPVVFFIPMGNGSFGENYEKYLCDRNCDDFLKFKETWFDIRDYLDVYYHKEARLIMDYYAEKKAKKESLKGKATYFYESDENLPRRK